MINSLDEEIKHLEKVVKEHEMMKRLKAVTLKECMSVEEHRQLAEWLRELKALKDFANFVAESVTEEEFEENSGFYAEVYCRKLHKMGFIEASDDKWIFNKREE